MTPTEGVCPVKFFVGLHDVHNAKHFDRSFISVNRLRNRRSDFEVKDWIMDSGAFTEVSTHGRYRTSVDEYAEQCTRWSRVGNFRRASIQDYMCEPFIVEKTGLSVREHQRLTIDRYLQLRDKTNAPLLPVIQGFQPREYIEHVEMYGNLLSSGMWVGVGSVCKRSSKPEVIEDILLAIKGVRPDLQLHGFGLKITSLRSPLVRQLLYSADSMAWSFQARKQGRDANDWREAEAFVSRIESEEPDTFVPKQIPLWI